MVTAKELIDIERGALVATVQEAIRAFETRTGFAVGGFTIVHHFSNEVMDSDMTIVSKVAINFPERS